jgi:hypothetical protein
LNEINCFQHNLTLLSYNHGIEEVNCTVSFDDDKMISKIYMPLWSWGFVHQCCDIYPRAFGRKHYSKQNQIYFDTGGHNDNEIYFYNKEIKNNSFIFLAHSHFPDFLKLFLQLPMDYVITLLTGLEDVGTPYEMFHTHIGRPNVQLKSWPLSNGTILNIPPLTMRDFIMDKRLKKWYTTQYDLIGCNVYTCSDVHLHEINLMNKVIPLPVGVDFHTTTRFHSNNNYDNAHNLLCSQVQEYLDISKNQIPFQNREISAIAAFECGELLDEDKKGRKEICNLVQNNKHIVNISFPSDKKRITFWSELQKHAFSLAPSGYGMDTHRCWEILQMGSIPIVINSPLAQKLYIDYPIIVINKWEEVFQEGALQQFKKEIENRYGKDVNPFTDEIKYKMSNNYWIKMIHD